LAVHGPGQVQSGAVEGLIREFGMTSRVSAPDFRGKLCHAIKKIQHYYKISMKIKCHAAYYNVTVW